MADSTESVPTALEPELNVSKLISHNQVLKMHGITFRTSLYKNIMKINNFENANFYIA